MAIANSRPFGQRYAFVVVGVIFLCLLIAAGLRSSMAVMMLPLEDFFGWRRDVISLAAAVGIFIYGLTGPFAAALMDRIGLRRTLIGALALMSFSTGLSLLMTQPWQLIATWGLMSGVGSGAVATVLGATIVNRWFKTNRGLMMGLMSASAATGLLVFLPVLAALASWGGWKPVAVTVAAATAALIPLVWLLVPERPSAIGTTRYGADGSEPDAPGVPGNFLQVTFGTLRKAAGTRVFWYLFATFFICGFTTNGLVGTHLIAFCGDMGIQEVQAASLLAMMGIFDLIGTTGSGWLTDRFDPRKLLGVYYGSPRSGADLSATVGLFAGQPRGFCGVLRARLDCNGAPDAAPLQRGVWRPQRAYGVWLDRCRPPGRRSLRGLFRWPDARNAGQL